MGPYKTHLSTRGKDRSLDGLVPFTSQILLEACLATGPILVWYLYQHYLKVDMFEQTRSGLSTLPGQVMTARVPDGEVSHGGAGQDHQGELKGGDVSCQLRPASS